MFAQIVEYVLRPCIARLFALHLCHYRHLPLESATGDPVAKKTQRRKLYPKVPFGRSPPRFSTQFDQAFWYDPSTPRYKLPLPDLASPDAEDIKKIRLCSPGDEDQNQMSLAAFLKKNKSHILETPPAAGLPSWSSFMDSLFVPK